MDRTFFKKLLRLNARIKGIGASASYAAKECGALDGADFENTGDVMFPYEITSPNGKIRVFFNRSGNLLYNVFSDNNQIIFNSDIGLVIKGINIGVDTVVGKPRTESQKTIYSDRGSSKTSTDEHISYVFPVRHIPTGLEYEVEFRLWNDGVGFRFIFRKGMRFLIDDEKTTFNLPTDSVCWYQTDVKKLQKRTVKQESRYLSDGVMACLATFQLANSGGYVMITEADLQNYPGAGLRMGGRGQLRIDLWDSDEFYVENPSPPWRLIIICKSLNELVNCKVIKNAAEPEREIFKDAGWIKPGKSSWPYFINEKTSRRYENVMLYNNYAHEMGFDYNLVDNGWGSWSLYEIFSFRRIKRVVDDAASKGVGIFVWKSVREGPFFSLYRKWFFKKCRKLGIKGVKFDHIESETQFMINLYRKLLEEAADNHLMVLFHNPQKPTGLSRTYPNLMSMEAIRGMQGNCDGEDNTILPFTRMVAGDADYTPLCYTVPARRGKASLAHMLANTVIYNSSFMTISEDPHVVSQQIFADFVRAVPVTWDRTEVLEQSEIGELAAFVRYKGDDIYIAVQNSASGARSEKIAIDFLADGKTYMLDMFCDDLDDQLGIKRVSGRYKNGDVIEISMRSEGGIAGRFTVI